MQRELEMVNYLTDHLAYEREMLGFTYRRLHEDHPQLQWNCYLESFAVHARNLYNFLRSDGGGGNFKANHYVPGHSAGALLAFNDLDLFVFHLTKARGRREKVNLGKVETMAAWVDREWKIWATKVPAPFGRYVDPRPVCSREGAMLGMSAISSGGHLTTTNSASTAVSFQSWPPAKR